MLRIIHYLQENYHICKSNIKTIVITHLKIVTLPVEKK